MVGVRLLQITLVIIFLGVIIYLLRLSHTLKLEKRIAKFSVNSVKDDNVSFFDKMAELIWLVVKKLSKGLKKSTFLQQYGEKYNKYILYEERDKKEGIDYVSFKVLIGIGVLFLSIVSWAFYKIHLDLMFFLIIFLISFFIPDIILNIEFNKKRKKVEEDLLKAIIIMNNAFQSGRNIMQAIEIVKNELDGPIADEFKKIYLDMNYGLSLDVVFERFYERVKLEDAKYITATLTLLNKTGGNVTKVFKMIEKSIFERKSLKNELESLTAASRFVFKMLIFLPIIFVIVIFVLNPSYFTPMFTTPLGIIILVFTILLYILYILIIKKVLEVEL